MIKEKQEKKHSEGQKRTMKYKKNERKNAKEEMNDDRR